MIRQLLTTILTSLLVLPVYAQTHRVDAQTSAETWESQFQGVTVQLTQILPDQLRAFYVNRGFPLAVTEAYAKACVYMTVLRNDSAPGVVHFKLENWRIESPVQSRPPLSLEHWMKQWDQHDLEKPALLAFRWAQFPAEHWYEPVGDWNQGMLTTGLPPGTLFNMKVLWDVDGEEFELVIRDVHCAK